jgi:hypothetical protein
MIQHVTSGKALVVVLASFRRDAGASIASTDVHR